MRRRVLSIISCVITIGLTALMLGYLTNLMERKSSRVKYIDFFDQKEDFDVLFLGTSRVINGIYPMELWNNYGIVSYNFGGHSNQLPTTYWVLKNALEYSRPKVVVIETAGIGNDWKCSDLFSYLHLSLDAFPLNVTKARAIWDLLNDPGLDYSVSIGEARESEEPRTKLGLLWDYSVYHSRWNELSKSDFVPEATQEKGAESRIAVYRTSFNKDYSDQTYAPGTGEKYLRMAIEECQASGIDVLLVYMPCTADQEQHMDANQTYNIAREYGVHYINFLDMELVNPQTDMHDGNHLNPSGARKVTSFLGQYLTANYNLPDQRQNEAFSFWFDDSRQYDQLKDRNLKGNKNLIEYLMLLSQDNVDVVIDVRNADLFNSDWVMCLLQNIGVNTEELDSHVDFVIVKDKGSRSALLRDFRADGSGVHTDCGDAALAYDSDGSRHDGKQGYYDLYLDGQICLTGNTEDNAGLQISVMRDGLQIDSVRFEYTVDPDTGEIHPGSANR